MGIMERWQKCMNIGGVQANFGGYWDPTSEKRVIDLMHVSQKG